MIEDTCVYIEKPCHADTALAGDPNSIHKTSTEHAYLSAITTEQHC